MDTPHDTREGQDFVQATIRHAEQLKLKAAKLDFVKQGAAIDWQIYELEVRKSEISEAIHKLDAAIAQNVVDDFNEQNKEDA